MKWEQFIEKRTLFSEKVADQLNNMVGYFKKEVPGVVTHIGVGEFVRSNMFVTVSLCPDKAPLVKAIVMLNVKSLDPKATALVAKLNVSSKVGVIGDLLMSQGNTASGQCMIGIPGTCLSPLSETIMGPVAVQLDYKSRNLVID